MGIRDWFGKKPAKTAAVSAPVEFDPISIPLGLEHLFIDASASDLERALDGWKWLRLDGLSVIAISAFGEPLLRDGSGVIHQLDTIEGKLLEVAATLEDLHAELRLEEARDRVLFEGLVSDARSKGLSLATGECYDFKVAPILGGNMSGDDIDKMPFVVKLHIAGQLHEQVKDLPPGTPINSVTISD